jgi:hypothetical protein
MAEPDPGAIQIPTTGEVTGGLQPPIIKAKWECTDDDPTTPGVQVYPLPCPQVTRVCMYLVARDPNGAADIVNAGFRVAHPAAPAADVACWMPTPVPEKYGYGIVQNHKMDEGTASEYKWWDGLNYGPDQPKIIAALQCAVASNQLTQAQADELAYELEQREARFFWACKDFDCCWAPGMYQIMAWASDKSGAQGDLINYLEYKSTIAIDLDFRAGVNYGTLTPGVTQILSGDQDMATLGKPTVKSIGNDPIQIWVHQTKMIGVLKGNEITGFDVRLDNFNVANFSASQNVKVPGVLRPCVIEKMDFSVKPPATLPSDTYQGRLDLWITHYVCPTPPP